MKPLNSNFAGISGAFYLRYNNSFDKLAQINGRRGLWKELILTQDGRITSGYGFYIFHNGDGIGPFSDYEKAMACLHELIDNDLTLDPVEQEEYKEWAKVYFGRIAFCEGKLFTKDIECVTQLI